MMDKPAAGSKATRGPAAGALSSRQFRGGEPKEMTDVLGPKVRKNPKGQIRDAAAEAKSNPLGGLDLRRNWGRGN